MKNYLIIILFCIGSSFPFGSSGGEKDHNSRPVSTNLGKGKVARESNSQPEGVETPDIESDELNNPIFIYISFFILGSIVTLIGVKIAKRSANKKRKKMKSDVQIPVAYSANAMRQNDSWMIRENKQLKERIATLDREMKERDKTDFFEPIPSTTVEFTIQKASLEIISEEKQDILYFPNPNSDSSFRKVDGKENYIEGASIYKFTIKSETTALFEFCENKSSVDMALYNRNDFIVPLAIEGNNFNPKATRILCENGDRGEVVLEGLLWRVKQKAKIKYI